MKEDCYKCTKGCLKPPKLNPRKLDIRQTPDDLPDLFFIGLISSSRGSGKSWKLLELLKMYDNANTFDTINFFCPTLQADPKYEMLNDFNAEVNTFDDYDDSTMEELIKQQDARIVDYGKEKDRDRLWKKFNRGVPLEQFNPLEIMYLNETDFKQPASKYPRGEPSCIFIFDDLMGNTSLYGNSNKKGFDFKKFAIKHRHHRASILFSTQAFKNGVPKCIRNNLSLLLLGANKSPQIKKEVADEVSAYVSRDQFVNMWDQACEKPFHFFMVNYEGPPDQKFRKVSPTSWNDYFTH
tara:strand:+ start:7807 stop:8691 length:885 start_codon:yes stop_codon:yes gene_type:complete